MAEINFRCTKCGARSILKIKGEHGNDIFLDQARKQHAKDSPNCNGNTQHLLYDFDDIARTDIRPDKSGGVLLSNMGEK